MPLVAVQRLFHSRAMTVPLGNGISDAELASHAPTKGSLDSESTRQTPASTDATESDFSYDVDVRMMEVEERLSTCNGDTVESPTRPLMMHSSRLQQGLPSRLFRTIKNSLGGKGGPTKQPSNECSRRDSLSKRQSSSSKRLSNRKSPALEQREIGIRISTYLTETFTGTREPKPMFVGEKEPPISFLEYTVRLIELTNKWVEEKDGPDSFGVRCAFLAVEYLERIDVRLDSKSVHRYFMAAFLIGIKLLYDYYISNSFWAEVSGCPRKQVNLMEVELCRELAWDFSVCPDKFAKFAQLFVR